MFESLLPPNATRAERAVEEATCPDVPVPLRELWDPWLCPEPLLPFLAWSRSVDEWSPEWPEDMRRRVIDDSFRQHAIKGTRAAVERAIRALGRHITIVEWWETIPRGEPYTFAVTLDTGAGSSTGVLQRHLIETINSQKNARSHYTVQMATKGTATAGFFGCGRVATFRRLSLVGHYTAGAAGMSQVTATGAGVAAVFVRMGLNSAH